MPALSPRRVERARPHWLVIDEAHQLLPSEWDGFAVFTQRALDIRAATGRNRPEKVAVLDRGVERVLRTYGLRRIGPQELEGECAEAAVSWPFRGFHGGVIARQAMSWISPYFALVLLALISAPEILAADYENGLTPPGAPPSAFPTPSRPVAGIVTDIWRDEESRDRASRRHPFGGSARGTSAVHPG